MSKKTKPNIIIIMTDQQRADLCGREGYPLDTTPFLDSMARQGCWFNRAYTTAPLCSPARISLLTGRYPGAHRVRENRGQQHALFERDLFDVMKEQGYKTALIGKNHTYLRPEDKLDHYRPYEHTGGKGNPNRSAEEIAYDEWLHDLKLTSDEATPFSKDVQCPARAVRDAIEWVEEVKEQPFCLWLSIPEPHTPFQAPEPYFSMFQPDVLPPIKSDLNALDEKGYKWKLLKQLDDHFIPNHAELLSSVRSNYLGMLRLIDDQIKRLHEAIDTMQLLEDTLFVFLSDHGDFAGEYGLSRKGPETPHVLMRIPLFFSGYGIRKDVQPQKEHISLADIMPTLCEAVGAPLPDGVQGRSIWPLLTQGAGAIPFDEFRSVYGEQGFGGLNYSEADRIDLEHVATPNGSYDPLNSYTQSGFIRSVWMGDWKLDLDADGNRRLYCISEDPVELTNLSGKSEHREIELNMLNELALWMIRTEDPLPFPANKYIRKANPRNYWREI
jgi:arylsulfatase A-like enzyme